MPRRPWLASRMADFAKLPRAIRLVQRPNVETTAGSARLTSAAHRPLCGDLIKHSPISFGASKPARNRVTLDLKAPIGSTQSFSRATAPVFGSQLIGCASSMVDATGLSSVEGSTDCTLESLTCAENTNTKFPMTAFIDANADL